LIKIIILEENFKRHLEAFASELFKYSKIFFYISLIADHFRSLFSMVCWFTLFNLLVCI